MSLETEIETSGTEERAFAPSLLNEIMAQTRLAQVMMPTTLLSRAYRHLSAIF